MSNALKPTVVRPGDSDKSNPFTILVIANPALEAPWRSGTFVSDPIIGNPAAFQSCVSYIETSLFTGLPSQAEIVLADPAIGPRVRLLSLLPTGLAAQDAFAFAAQDGASELLVARRNAIRDFLVAGDLAADIVYVISSSPSHRRASAWFTSDDDMRGGVPFVLDGVTFHHRHHYTIPGTIAMHHTADSLTAVHEFGHAISSYTNGQIVDLYVDSTPGINNKAGRPIPADFAKMNAPTFATDATRGPLGYPASWNSYHCELHDTGNPALMDNYYQAPGGVAELCQNDRITRAFIRDRLLAKLAR